MTMEKFVKSIRPSVSACWNNFNIILVTLKPASVGHLSDYINISQASKKIIASMQQRIRSHWECCLEQNTTKEVLQSAIIVLVHKRLSVQWNLYVVNHTMDYSSLQSQSSADVKLQKFWLSISFNNITQHHRESVNPDQINVPNYSQIKYMMNVNNSKAALQLNICSMLNIIKQKQIIIV